MAYLLDTNVFIEAYRKNYCSEFWDWLIRKNEESTIYSIKEVCDEIKDYGNDLSHWVRGRDENFFINSNSGVISRYQDIGQWINEQDYTSAAVKKFKEGADGFLIAHALSAGGEYKVVTEEVWRNSRHKIKIPNVCQNFEVYYMNTQEMLQREQVTFPRDCPGNDN